MGETKPLKIFLTDLGHTYFSISPATIPIGIAYISAALKDKFKNDVDVRLFKYPKKFLASLDEEKPDIVGMGLYNWNQNLSVDLAKNVRKKYPDVLLVVGGLNIPGTAEQIQKQYVNNYGSLFDIYVPYEGEGPMMQIVERVLTVCSKKDALKTPISGCFVYNDGELKKEEPIPMFIEDVLDIPSPYLTGTVDDLLNDPLLTPVIQSMRGCPFTCSFCVGGKKEYSKIRLFSLERVKDEILYLKKKAKNRVLRITDENFGLLERDIELAKFINKLFHTENYPEALKVYTDKAINDRVKEVMLLLKDLIPHNISLQTTTPEVLKNIRRKNPPLEDISEAFRWAKRNKIVTATELLHGFPGETYDSFMECVNNLYKIRVDSASAHEVWTLPNTSLSSEESREKHGITTRFKLGDDAISIINDKLICEYDEHLVSSKYMSIDEHYKLCKMDLFISLTLHFGFFRELTYHAMTYDIKPTDIYNEIISSSEKYPVLNSMFSMYIEKVMKSHHKTKEGVYNQVKSIIGQNKPFPPTRFIPVVIGEFVFNDVFTKGIEEYIGAAIELFSGDETSKEEFIDACWELKKFTINKIINPENIQEHINFESYYNFSDWIANFYEKRLVNYYHDTPIKMRFSIPNLSHVEHLHERGKKLRTKSERVQNFFRHTNSSCFRRRLSNVEKPCYISSSIP